MSDKHRNTAKLIPISSPLNCWSYIFLGSIPSSMLQLKNLSFSHTQPISKTCLPYLQNNANTESDQFTSPPLLSPGPSHYHLLPTFCNGLWSRFHSFTFALLWSVSSRATIVMSLHHSNPTTAYLPQSLAQSPTMAFKAFPWSGPYYLSDLISYFSPFVDSVPATLGPLPGTMFLKIATWHTPFPVISLLRCQWGLSWPPY